MIKLNLQGSNEYAGIVNLPILGKILKEYSVKFAATIVAAPSRYNAGRERDKKNNLGRPQICSVRIVVYGLGTEISAVGDMLSNADLYLQQPSASECERDIEYSNPHYLVRPGSKMPNLSDLSISSDTGSKITPEKLDEVNKSRLLQLFDVANDTSIRAHFAPSPRLSSSLKE